MAQQLTKRAREAPVLLLTLSVFFMLVSCSIALKIPDVVDDRVKELVRSEAAHVLMVSEERKNFSKYQFFLTDFPRQDLLGMSLGNGKIYISYKLAARALTQTGYLWLLRQTVAHEIAHEAAGHATQKYCGGSPAVISFLAPRVKRSGYPGMSGCITIRLRKSSKRIGSD